MRARRIGVPLLCAALVAVVGATSSGAQASARASTAQPPRAWAHVTYISGASIYLDAGTRAGLKEGSRLEVVRGNAVIAELAVAYVSSTRSSCIVVTSSSAVAVGDSARFTPIVAVVAQAAREAAPTDSARARAEVRAGARASARPIRGRLGVRYLSLQQAGEGVTSTLTQPAFDIRLDGRNIGGTPFGLVVDVRDNPGGYDTNAQYVAGRFARDRRPYMRVRKRSGPERGQFGPRIDWYVAPTGDRQFTGPIALLTSYATQSAGETFCLAMRERDDVVSIGDTTAGAFSDAILREAGNGWAYTISVGDYRAADGLSYEGIGLAPDREVPGSAADLEAGHDLALEAAIAELGPL